MAIEAAERMAVEVKLLKDDFQDERDDLEGQKREILADLAALEERYLNRESRSEDLARIQELEQEMVDKDVLVAKTKEEMLYFKVSSNPHPHPHPHPHPNPAITNIIEILILTPHLGPNPISSVRCSIAKTITTRNSAPRPTSA